MQQLPRPREEVIAECRMRLARYTAQAERMCSIANDLKERFNNQRKSTYNQMKLCVAQMSADCRRQYRDAISRLNNANERAKQIAAAICGIRDEFYNVDCDVLAQEEQHIGGERGDGLGRLQSLLRRLEEWQAILADAENTANLWDNAIRKLLARCNCIACHPEGTGVRSRCAQ